MATDIHNLIAAINPEIYCDPDLKDEVKKTVKDALERGDKDAYVQGAKIAKPKEVEFVDPEKIVLGNPFDTPGFKYPSEKHEVSYDLAMQSLEPIYFWLLDYINIEYKKSSKIIDNFVAAPGSGHYSEVGQKATRMQEEAIKIMGSANTVLRSILNIIYDLKEFRMRLEDYSRLESDNKAEKESAWLALKQVWMDNVDIKRGNTAIKAMAQNFDYVTVIDAFMAAKSLEAVDDIDLNDRVKRIIKQRFADFEKWVKASETELKKRYEIEKSYLKSQVASLKLYARWAKPYLKAAKQLEQRMDADSSVVNLFNTTLMELTVLGEREMRVSDEVGMGNLPEMILDVPQRKQFMIVVSELKFRSVPDRNDQRGGYQFRGRVDMAFTSYALNEDELAVLKDQVDRDDLQDLFGLVEGATSDSLGEIQVDLDDLLEGKNPEEEAKKKEKKGTATHFHLFLVSSKRTNRATVTSA